MDLPQNLKYTKEHEWVKIDGDLLIVGITDHAQSELGDIIFIVKSCFLIFFSFNKFGLTYLPFLN